MGRILLLLTVVLVAAMLAMKPLLNLSPLALPAAIEVATGLGAKLACSGRYVSKIDARQMGEDLATYSAAFSLVDIRYDDDQRRTQATLGVAGSQSASYRDGLGCTIDLPGANKLDAIRVTPPQISEAPWPLGNSVTTATETAQDALDSYLARDTARGEQTRALVVAHRGEIVAESYASGFDSKSTLLGWSMGKSVTAILVGLLEYRGILDIADQQLFAPWRADERGDITLQQLLQMSSGLQFNEEYTPGSDATHMLSAAPSAAAVGIHQPLIHTPGKHFAYSSGTTNMLARLVHDRLGGNTQQTVDFIDQQLYAPLGMHHFLMELDPSGVPVGSSFVYGSGRDWARLGQLMLRGGELNGRRLLSEDWVRRATAPNPSGNDPRYGYQFWLNGGGTELRWPDLPADAYAMLGNRGQVVMIIPSLELIIVRLGWSTNEYPTNVNLARLVNALLPQ